MTWIASHFEKSEDKVLDSTVATVDTVVAVRLE